ncbi:hypothetical protein [Candidatus Nanohalovita haloferacivicina]|uniref:hypothetical protein n=1 Tax=Candidatus Nanohalovita haloferacivicina TaxID=2978046 RepID=UPI00325FD78C|nr:hypothetical protein HBNXNv_0286 [Candidatus Nanohalobia archaeon BNXNv]
MNALFFTYTAVFLFAFLPNFGLVLNFSQISAGSAVFTVIVNLWALYNEKPIMDERKREITTNGMAWAFVTVSLALIAAGTTSIEINLDFIRDVSELGLWTFIMYLSLSTLYHQFGGGE